MTLTEAKNLKVGDYIHHTTKKNADGTPMRAKVTSIKTWKRPPERIEVRCKCGLYEYATFTENELSQIAVGYGEKMNLDHVAKTKRYLLHYVDSNSELDELNYFVATDIDEAYRQALPLLDGREEYQMSEL